jgi:antitoxin component YwqK of YwqJK toxin-antitoxin module
MRIIRILLISITFFACGSNESQNTESTNSISKRFSLDILDKKGTDENPIWIYKGVPVKGLGMSYFENGQLQYEYNFKDGKEDGVGKTWYENGQLEFECNFKEGNKNGLETLWYENGQKRIIGYYKNGKEDGPHKSYQDDGTLGSETNYKNGLKHGLYKSYDNGVLFWEENYKDGIKDGLSRIYSTFSDMETEEMWKEDNNYRCILNIIINSDEYRC